MSKLTNLAKKKLYYIPKPTRWSQGIGAELPEAYKKFWKEWKLTPPAPVHYVPKEGRFEKKEDGQIVPIQNIPIPLKYPKELHEGIWGGEAVVAGFVKKHYQRRFRRYWVPVLMKSVVYSEILDKYMRMMVTHRTMTLIHENYGFDHYILKTPACDLYSELALKLKREMLLSLYDKSLYPDNQEKREEVYQKYQKYLEQYTREEIEWYGLNYAEASRKLIQMKKDAYNPIPLKVLFRQQYLEQLKGEKEDAVEEKTESSWLSKINPFGSSSKSD